MKFYSSKDKSTFYSLSEAVLKGLPDDNGLFMPASIPQLPEQFIKDLQNKSFPEIAFEISKMFLKDDIPEAEIKRIVDTAINFEAPLVKLDDYTFILELYHGPTLAFKDFGARFMAQLMLYLRRDQQIKTTILVATSGDTGSAVANGFYRTEGMEVIILYPSQKVSFLQEKQLTTLGENITTLEVKGNFDDCQRLVKAAFLDADLKKKYKLASANSINIARLIPQSFYYFEAFKHAPLRSKVVFSVPSGNFGNLTAGLIAKRMGLPVKHFVASVNSNKVFANYLSSGKYEPGPSVQTYSNAMDVGNPSNFARMMDLYENDVALIKKDISAYSFDDAKTLKAMDEVFKSFNYLIDPHGAVGYLGWKQYQKENQEATGIILETAHPAKFLDVVEKNPGIKVKIPDELQSLANKKKTTVEISIDFAGFKSFLLGR